MNPLEIGDLVAKTVMRDHEIFPSYTADLALEGLLYMYDATKNEDYLNHVLKVWDFREKHDAVRLDTNILFTCIHFETYLRTGDSRFISSFNDEATQWRLSVPRDKDGAVCYHILPESKRIFIDMLQGYAVFMARAGFLSGDAMFYEECVKQYETFRNILRNPSTGLWHQGRNWGNKPGFISPGYWNRGQGWVLRGLVDSMDWLPKDSGYFARMKNILNEFSSGLIRYQDARGMWHQLTDFEEAYPETCGTAFIVHYFYKGFHRGWLSRDPFLSSAEKGIIALMGFVRKDGIVLNTSQGTGPLMDMEGYLHRPSIPGDPHAAGTMLMACAGPWLAREPKNMVSV
jgi:unsaturated rhamnogalacturonyl hydrolase